MQPLDSRWQGSDVTRPLRDTPYIGLRSNAAFWPVAAFTPCAMICARSLIPFNASIVQPAASNDTRVVGPPIVHTTIEPSVSRPSTRLVLLRPATPPRPSGLTNQNAVFPSAMNQAAETPMICPALLIQRADDEQQWG